MTRLLKKFMGLLVKQSLVVLILVAAISLCTRTASGLGHLPQSRVSVPAGVLEAAAVEAAIRAAALGLVAVGR
jgi:hypothetical protein